MAVQPSTLNSFLGDACIYHVFCQRIAHDHGMWATGHTNGSAKNWVAIACGESSLHLFILTLLRDLLFDANPGYVLLLQIVPVSLQFSYYRSPHLVKDLRFLLLWRDAQISANHPSIPLLLLFTLHFSRTASAPPDVCCFAGARNRVKLASVSNCRVWWTMNPLLKLRQESGVSLSPSREMLRKSFQNPPHFKAVLSVSYPISQCLKFPDYHPCLHFPHRSQLERSL